MGHTPECRPFGTERNTAVWADRLLPAVDGPGRQNGAIQLFSVGVSGR
jgi:hypothetical protein